MVRDSGTAIVITILLLFVVARASDGFDGEDAGASGLPVCGSVEVVRTPAGEYRVPARSLLADPDDQFDCQLSIGADDDQAVTALQRALVRCHGAAIAVDGMFGGGTRQALVDAQASVGVVADGTYGPQTSRALEWPAKGPGGTTCVAHS